MPQNQMFTALLVFSSVLATPVMSQGPDESTEPPLKYTIEIGNQKLTVSEEKPYQLSGTFTDPIISVTPNVYRVFPYQGIEFRYPKSFIFEAELEDRVTRNWTLSGNDLTIMYFVIDAPLTTGDFVNNLIDQFGREKTTIVKPDTVITLGEEKLNGMSLEVTLVGNSMAIDVFRVPSQEAITKLLVFQDSLDDSGNRSEEGRKTIAQIKSSFKIDQSLQ